MNNKKCKYCNITEEELHKKMIEYSKKVSKTKELAYLFLKRIGAL